MYPSRLCRREKVYKKRAQKSHTFLSGKNVGLQPVPSHRSCVIFKAFSVTFGGPRTCDFDFNQFSDLTSADIEL